MASAPTPACFFLQINEPNNPNNHKAKNHENDPMDSPRRDDIPLKDLKPIGVIFAGRVNPITAQCYSTSDTSAEAMTAQDCVVLYIGGSTYLYCP